MENFDKDIQDQMNALADRYAAELRNAVSKELSKPSYKSSGMLASSVKVSVTPSTGYKPPVINLEVADYGELIGKRKMLWVKQPPLQKMIDHIQKKNISLTKIPGYVSGAPNLPESKKIERVAFAMAVKKRRDDTFKRRPWKKQSFPDVLRKLNSETIEKFGGHIERMLASSIATK
jgi:hypothetical protein